MELQPCFRGRCLRLASGDVHPRQDQPAEDEEHDDRQHGDAARVEERDRGGEHRRSGTAGEFLEDREEPEVLRRLVLRDQAREQRAAQRLAATAGRNAG